MDSSFLFYLVFFISSINCIDVTTPFGNLTGTVIRNESISFLGVPYAKPPIGAKRFQPASYPFRWNGTRDATKYGPACMQPASSQSPGMNVSEDCLTLDIYVDGNSINKTAKMSVLVFIHGGGFVGGTSADVDLSKFVAGNGIIAVAIQYRLGLLGFAQSPDDKIIPGNIGLKDQITALKWVRNNINNFGGDGEQVTVAGESAGSISIGYHLISSMAKKTMKRVILESGAPKPVLSPEQVQANMHRVIESTDCVNKPTNEQFECLRSVQIDKLIEIQTNLSSEHINFNVSLDSKFFGNKDPMEHVRLGKFILNLESIMMGQNGNEGAIVLANFVPDLFPLNGNMKSKTWIPSELKSMKPFYPYMSQSSWEKMIELTFANRSSINETKLANTMGLVMSDEYFNCDHRLFLSSYRQSWPTTRMYYYNFLARPSKPETRKVMPYIRYALHGEELPFFYGQVLLNESAYTPEEMNLSKRLISELTTFVKSGTVADSKWPRIQLDDLGQPKYSHVVIDSNNTEYRSGLPSLYCDQLSFH